MKVNTRGLPITRRMCTSNCISDDFLIYRLKLLLISYRTIIVIFSYN